MLADLKIHAGATAAAFRKHRHILVILSATTQVTGAGEPQAVLRALLKRRNLKQQELAKKPLCANLADGTLVAWTMPDAKHGRFEALAAMRAALGLLLAENPLEVAIVAMPGAATVTPTATVRP